MSMDGAPYVRVNVQRKGIDWGKLV